MLSLLALCSVLQTTILACIKPLRKHWTYQFIWLPFCIISLIILIDGFMYSEEYQTYQYTKEQQTTISETISITDDKITKIETVEYTCVKRTFIHHDNFVVDIYNGNFISKHKENVSLKYCK